MVKYIKKYREENKTILGQKHKEYIQNNKQKIQEYRKKKYQENKDKMNKKINCEKCGAVVSIQYLKHHQKKNTCITNCLN